MDKTQPHPLFKFATEVGPLVVFFAVNAKFHLFVATGAFMVAIVVAMIASYVVTRHVPLMSLVTGIVVLISPEAIHCLDNKTGEKKYSFAIARYETLRLRNYLQPGSPLRSDGEPRSERYRYLATRTQPAGIARFDLWQGKLTWERELPARFSTKEHIMTEKEIHSRTKIGLLSLRLSIRKISCFPALPAISHEVLDLFLRIPIL